MKNIDKKIACFDFETHGLSKHFSSPSELAIVDQNTTEYEVWNFRCRPGELVNAEAMITCKRSWEDYNKGATQFEAYPDVLKFLESYDHLLAWNADFDRQISSTFCYAAGRFPWSFEKRNQRNIIDALPIFSLFSKLFPDQAIIPEVNGRLSHKLEYVYEANIPNNQKLKFHNALADTYATKDLINIIVKKEPKFLNVILEAADKNNQMECIGDYRDSFINYNWQSMSFQNFLTIAPRPDYKSFFAINLDIFGGLTESDKAKILDWDGDPKKLPKWLVEQYPSVRKCCFKRNEIVKSDLIPKAKNHIKLSELRQIDKLIFASPLNQIKEFDPAEYFEEKKFGFPNRREGSGWSHFFDNKVSWHEKSLIKFHNPLDREVAERIIYEHAPHVLDPNIRYKRDKEVREKLLNTDPKIPWETVPKVMAQIEHLEQKDPSLRSLFKTYRSYLNEYLQENNYAYN